MGPSPESERRPHQILGTIEITAALTAFGYMALRAHWNYLGVTSMAGVGVDRYLMEVCAILAGEVPYALIAALAITVVFFVLRLLVRLVRKHIPWFENLLHRIETSMLKLFSVVVLISVAAAQIALLRRLSSRTCNTDILIGDLKQHTVDGCYDPPSGLLLFHAVLIVCIAVAFLYRRKPDDGLTKIVAVAGVLVALQLPMLYGMRVKEARYPGTRIVTLGAPPLIGLLVLQTTDAVEVWTAPNGKGELLVVPRDRIESMQVAGVRDAFTVARTVASNPAELPKVCGIE